MSKPTILLVDDCVDLLHLEKQILEGHGFDILTAQSGAEAFEILGKNKQLSLIILDIQMEDMDGDHFLKILELESPELFRKIPVVFLSGAHPPVSSKAAGFIPKFPEIPAFLKAVHGFIKH